MQSAHLLNLEVEVSHEEVGEVVACQLEEQLVFVEAVGLVGNHEDERDVVLGAQLYGGYRVAVAHHHCPAAPHVAHVELAALQFASCLHAVDDHSRQFADAAVGEFLHHLVHVLQASVAVAVVQLGQSADEDELIAVGAQWEARSREFRVLPHLAHPVGLERLVGRRVKRVLHVLAEAGVLHVVRVGEQRCPLALGILFLQFRQPRVRLRHIPLAGVEQVEVVVYVVHLLELAVLVGKPAQVTLAEPQVVQLVLEDDSRVEESVLDHLVAGCHLFLGKGNLRQVVLALVRVVLGAVGHVCQRVLDGHCLRYRVGLLGRQVVVVRSVGACCRSHHRLVHAPPVVLVLALSPQFLERRLTLSDGYRVVEVPRGLLRVVSVLLLGCVLACPRVAAAVALHLLLGIQFGLLFALLLLFFLQRLNHAVDGSVAVFLAHLRQRLQRVLQVNRLGMWRQLVQNLRAFRQLLIVVAVLVQQTDGLTVASSCVAELLLLPVQVAQMQQQHTLLDAAAGAFLVAFLVGGNGARRIFLCQVDVADGVVHLVEIVLVVVVGGHTLQLAYHLPRPAASHHLGHRDAGVELNLVGRVQPYHMLERLVCLVALALCRIDLPEQIPLARLLLAAHLVLDNLAQVGHSLVELLLVQVVVGIRVVPLLHRPPVHRVAAHLRDYVLGVVGAVVLDIAFCQPGARLAVDGGLRLVQAAHIGEGDGGLLELALHELRAPHQQPCLPEERVVLQAAQPLYVALRLLAVLRPFGLALDAVQLDGLLAFLYGALEVALANLLAAFVADGVERNHLGKVVLVAVLLLQRSVDICHRAVVVGVVFRVERVPPAGARRVLCGRACRHNHGCRAYDDNHRKHAQGPGNTPLRAAPVASPQCLVASHILSSPSVESSRPSAGRAG